MMKSYTSVFIIHRLTQAVRKRFQKIKTEITENHVQKSAGVRFFIFWGG